MSEADNFYSILGLSRDATEREIRQAYLAAARRLHPDVNKDPDAGTVFLKVQHAYETLTDPVEREKYNQNHPDEDADLPIHINIINSHS